MFDVYISGPDELTVRVDDRLNPVVMHLSENQARALVQLLTRRCEQLKNRKQAGIHEPD
jgi:hypothetical protein